MALARKISPDNIEGSRQRMQRAVAKSKVSYKNIFSRLQKTIAEKQERSLKAFCIDDTGIEKQGDLSVGVQRQYSGTLGKVGNCQVLTTLHAVSNNRSFCIDGQLYLPQCWIDNKERKTEGTNTRYCRIPNERSDSYQVTQRPSG